MNAHYIHTKTPYNLNKLKTLPVTLLLNICFVAFFTWEAEGQHKQEQTISISFEDEGLLGAIEYLGNHFPQHFYFRKEWLPEKSITHTFEGASLEEVLKTVLEGTGLTFSKYQGYAVLIVRESDLSKEFSMDYFLAKQASAENILSGLSLPRAEKITFGNPETPDPSGKVTISGAITDRETNSPLVGVGLIVENLGITTVTDANGKYTLEAPTGTQIIKIQYVGYDTRQFVAKMAGDSQWDLSLEQVAFELEEVMISGEVSDRNVQSAQVGAMRISTFDIKQLPAFMGEADVVRTILTLPGVSTVGEGATGFNVRGGNIDQNLVMLDESIIFNSSHVLGLFSVFNPDVLSGAVLYKGNIPAQYGGRVSSVLDIKQKAPNTEKLKVNGGLGVVSSRLAVEAPVWKDKTSLMLGGRANYSDWVLQLMKDPDLNASSAFFYDFNGKLTHRLGNGSSLSLSYYQSFDRLRYADQFGFSWQNRTGSLNYNQVLSAKISASFTASFGDLQNSFFEPEGANAFQVDNGIRNYKVKQNFFWNPNDRHDINFGAEGIRYEGHPEKRRPFHSTSEIATEEIGKDSGNELAFYINDEFEVNNWLGFSLGLRYSLYQQTGPGEIFYYQEGAHRSTGSTIGSATFGSGEKITSYNGWEPRASMKIGLSPTSSVKLSYNRLYQYIHLISNTTSAVPVDLWQVSTAYLPPQVADNFSLGYFQNFSNNLWETSAELFYRDIQSLIDFKDFATLLMNRQIETELLNGRGVAYGGELSIKKNKGLWTGWLSYTFSRSLRQVLPGPEQEGINNGAWFPANFDQPHNLNLVFNLKVRRRNMFSANFVYSSGRPITAPIASYYVEDSFVPHFSARNAFRIPDYHRLDLSYTFHTSPFVKQRYRANFTFSIYNVYGRRNPFSVFFQIDPNTAVNAYRLSVLGSAFPAITYNFEF